MNCAEKLSEPTIFFNLYTFSLFLIIKKICSQKCIQYIIADLKWTLIIKLLPI